MTISTEKIEAILEDWQTGKTHGYIRKQHELTREQECAITNCSEGLTVAQIQQRLSNLKEGMQSVKIKQIMEGK